MEADDNKTDNRLSEPEVAYERTPKASATEEIGDKYPWLRAYPDYLQEWERLEHPQPCTVEERRDTIALDLILKAQNPGLNPELIVSAIRTYCPDAAPDYAVFHRRAVLDEQFQPWE